MKRIEFLKIYRFNNFKHKTFSNYVGMLDDAISRYLANKSMKAVRGDYISALQKALYELRDIKINLMEQNEIDEYINKIESTGWEFKERTYISAYAKF